MPDARPILLMTRPQAVSEGFIAALRGRGAVFDPIISPLMDIVRLPVDVPAEDVRGLIFTSAHGVAAWQALSKGRPLKVPAYVVGQATAQAARGIGLYVAHVAQDADALVEALTAAPVAAPLLRLAGRHQRGEVAERLTNAGLPTRTVTLYDQPQQPLNESARAALIGTVPVVAPVFSPRSGKLLAMNRVEAPLLVAAMSEAVAIAVAPLHIEVLKVAARPDSPAMLDAVTALLVEAAKPAQSLAQSRARGGDAPEETPEGAG